MSSQTKLTSIHTDAEPQPKHLNLMEALRRRLEAIEIRDRQLARWLCKAIPPQCPFERDFRLLGHTVLHIPPLCKLNPFYEQLVSLRFRALCLLADVYGEDIAEYCR